MYHCGVDVLHVPSLGPVPGTGITVVAPSDPNNRKNRAGEEENIPNRKGDIGSWKDKAGLKNQSSLVVKPAGQMIYITRVGYMYVLISAPRDRTIGKQPCRISRALFDCSKSNTPSFPNLPLVYFRPAARSAGITKGRLE